MTKPTQVVNLKVEAYDVYIGRDGHGYGGGYFGNPFHRREERGGYCCERCGCAAGAGKGERGCSHEGVWS